MQHEGWFRYGEYDDFLDEPTYGARPYVQNYPACVYSAYMEVLCYMSESIGGAGK